MSRRILIRGGRVLTLGARLPNFDRADVLVEDGRIAEVGRGLRARDADVIDAAEAIVMPGFVDTHRHAWRSLFRNLVDTGADGRARPGADEHARYYQPDDVYAATLASLLGAVEAGITTLVDWSDIQLEDRYTEAALEAHRDAGLRTVLVHAVPPWAGVDEEAALRRLVAAHGTAPAPSTTLAAAAPGGLAEPERVARHWTTARELGLRVHAHAGVDPADRGRVADLAGRGLLGADVTLAHGTGLGDADLDAVAGTGAAVSLVPSSDMTSGRGVPPVQALIDRGVRPGLGVDDEQLAAGDLFAEMRLLHSVQHAAHFELKLAGKAGLPHLVSTREVIRYATVDGARVAGLGAVTGSLEPGKQADILVLRTDRPNISPVNDPIGAVVWGVDCSNVDWVLAGGRPLVRGGVLDADVARARRLATAARQRVAAAADHLLAGSGESR